MLSASGEFAIEIETRLPEKERMKLRLLIVCVPLIFSCSAAWAQRMMKKEIAAVCIVMLFVGYGAEPASEVYARASSVNPRADTPRFEGFPVSRAEQFKGKPAAIRPASPEARKCRTVIREGAREGPNFAGHYTIVEWGCGAGCVQFAVVDAKTGSVFMPPFYVASRAPVEGETPEPLKYHIDSKLMIVNGSRNERGEGVYYYKWDNGRLELIKAVASRKS